MSFRWLCLFVLGFAVSCASSADGAAPSENADISTTTVAVTTTALADSEARWLTSSLATERTADGWLLPAGTWATDVFGDPMLFDTSSDLTLVAESDRLVYLATPGNRNLIMIAWTSGMWNGSADVPVPEEAAAMTKAWEANPANTVTANGELNGATPVPWWDITLTEMTDFTYPCWLGLDCAFSTFGGDAKVHSLQGERMRSYARNDIEVGLGIHASGSAAGIDNAILIADEIASSLRRAEITLPEKARLQFLGSLADPSLPAGSLVAPAGDHALQFTLSEPRPDLEWVSHLGGVEIFSDQGGLIVAPPVLVDPDVVPTFCPPSQVSPPQGLPAYTTAKAKSAAEFEDYLRKFADITASGETELLGETATWWEVGDPLEAQTVRCKGPDGFTDTAFFLAVQEGGLPFGVDEDGTLRVHRLDPSGLMVAAYTVEDGLDPMALFQDVLDGLSLP